MNRAWVEGDVAEGNNPAWFLRFVWAQLESSNRPITGIIGRNCSRDCRRARRPHYTSQCGVSDIVLVVVLVKPVAAVKLQQLREDVFVGNIGGPTVGIRNRRIKSGMRVR